MIIKTYDNFKINNKERTITLNFFDSLIEESGFNHKALNSHIISKNIYDSFEKIYFALNKNLKNKKILDLGCGAKSKNAESQFYGQIYEPWLARFLESTSELTGIKVIGVDCGNLSREKFAYKQIDLLQKNSLEENFSETKFDLVHACMLFNSPELETRVSGKKTYSDAKIETSKKLKEILLPQLEKIIQPEGTLIVGGGEEAFKDELITKSLSSYADVYH